jgi:hypothetical protein
MINRFSRHIRANVWGIAAVFIALTGTAAALPGKNKVDSGDIRKGNVKLSDLATNSVDSSKVVDDALTGADIQESSLEGIEGPQGEQGAQGERGPQGPRGPAGPAGSNATVNGVAAGGELAGTYPDPLIAVDAVGVDEVNGLVTDDEVVDGGIDGQDVANGTLDSADIENPSRSFTIGVSEVADPVFTRAADTAPSRTTLGGYIPALGFSAATENAFLLTFQLPSDFAAGSGLSVRLRWSGAAGEAAANQVVWGGELDSYAQLADVTPASPELSATATPTASTTADQLRINTLSFPSPGAAITPGDLVLLRVSREVANASDDYTSVANLHAVGVSYEASS